VSQANLGWAPQGFLFSSSAPWTTITFASPGNPSGVIGIDSVVVKPLIPTNLILNGSFESPVVGSGLLDVNPGVTIGNWTQSLGGVKGHYLGTNWQAADGAQSYHLGAGAGAGSVYQAFATDIGAQYMVDFWASGFHTGAAMQYGTLAVGDLTATYWTPGGTSDSNMAWAEHAFFFTALSTLTTLTFSSPGGTNIIGIDRVAVYRVGNVPEPASAILLLLGAGMLRRRMRRK